MADFLSRKARDTSPVEADPTTTITDEETVEIVDSAPAPKNRKRTAIRAGIVLALVAPLLFAMAWMWSMWDPSHYLSDVKLAVVNEDAGANSNGQQVNYGSEVVKGLLETEYLNVTDVSAADADRGLHEGKYLAVLQIPKDFSAKVITVIDEHPQQPNVIVSYNDLYGTNSPLLTSGLIPGIQQGINESIAQGYGTEILGGMNQLSAGLKEAADGAKQLDDGAAQMKDGTQQGIDGSILLDDGMAQLLDGTHQLGDGAAQIDDGVGQLTGMLIPALRQAGTAAQNLRPLMETLDRLGAKNEAAQLREIIDMLDNNNPEAMANQLQLLKNGTAEMRYNLTDPSAPYLSGVLQLKDGTRQLREGSYLLDDGARQIKDGTNQLYTGLSEGAQQAPQISDIASSSNQLAVPVVFPQEYLHPVQRLTDLKDPTSKVLSEGVTIILVLVFGTLMMALASMLAPVLVGIRKGRSVFGQVVGGTALLSVLNLVLLALLSLAGAAAGFKPASIPLYALALVVLAVNGAATFQAFRVVFGTLVGAIISLALFAYGVMSFGGVWPIQLTPHPLRVINVIHPMTYAHDVFSRAVDHNPDGVFIRGIVILVLFTVAFLAVSIVARRAQLARGTSHGSTTRSPVTGKAYALG